MRFLLILLVIAVGEPGLACSLEIYSVAHNLQQSEVVLVGRIDSLDSDILEEDPLSGHTVREVRAVHVHVERVFKGTLTQDFLTLSFDPSLAWTSCANLLQPYQEGAYLLLMLDQTETGMMRRGPLIPPRVVPLDADYAATPMYRYVEALLAGADSPLAVTFAGAQSVRWGDRVLLTVSVTNGLDAPVVLQVGTAPVPTGFNDPILHVALDQRGDHTFQSLAVDTSARRIASGESADVSVNLSEHYQLTDMGDYGLTVRLRLPIGDGEVYDDNWGNYQWLWSFNTDISTPVLEVSWGTIKGFK